ncbi:hypothetical protein APHWI1_0685 [Anaplasma phagocytophilum str. ApWI1]|uniref:Uncharacterized protein n=1 Tax=Anaplasma phagocytophilum str. ApWI1 TaxID=1359155 RepID=A0A0F3PXT7_ANAPH|nr:hypothetical protein [Anaplasma phagocytophilum]KJV82216.1 hypothetical protein APHHGE2_1481 [Anaplasma phagocytophilum str. HGE2]KJV85073.1 hypothetical protein APHWI1_0685 [Anaplasma phagocytophilum str. ApWI1]KJV98106.1 hypothetical protein OTSANNIE_1457 [Anaplasma phagocytophilum str. Annie]KJZ98991.1 hypothetical protein APHCR_0663 [Anaplasma phagocytophilum str. CR1007]AGR82172.1 hypothetical protein YYY_05315 [Anaplasma phagocytophilum str. Dog2]
MSEQHIDCVVYALEEKVHFYTSTAYPTSAYFMAEKLSKNALEDYYTTSTNHPNIADIAVIIAP